MKKTCQKVCSWVSGERSLTLFGCRYVFNSSTDARRALELSTGVLSKEAAEFEARLKNWGVEYRLESRFINSF